MAMDEERKEKMISMRYRGMNTREIADCFGISRERVRQIIGNMGHSIKWSTKIRESKRYFGIRHIKSQMFWESIDIKTRDECWEWKKSRFSFGYGKTRFGYSHRIAYEQINGPIPEGLVICHKCNNPACCNPFHLYAGTPKQNMQDRENRYKNGELDRYAWRRDHNIVKKNKLNVIGVSKDGNRYKARISGKLVGTFKSLKDACRAYDRKAVELFGDNAHLNFPNEAG